MIWIFLERRSRRVFEAFRLNEAMNGLTFKPLTPRTWDDFELLFGERGACGGCWCMAWRLSSSQFERQKGKQNKTAMKKIVSGGETPGILAYLKGRPVGWCAVAPRERYPRLERSRVLKPLDDAPVWSVVCFFVAKPFRRQGMSVELLRAAISHVRRKRGKIVEGYPFELKKGPLPDPFVWTGLASAFARAGFRECARRSPTRPIMRFEV